MIDYRTARANMVENQVRPNGVTDHRLIAAMAELPRELFVPDARRDIAYMDEDIPLKKGRWLIEPMAQARLIQLAAITRSDSVLHIGCATGYGTAILARLAQSVTAIDEDPELSDMAASLLAELGSSGTRILQAPHAGGAPAAAPFDVIVIEGAVQEIPKQLLSQLKDGGRLAAVIGNSSVGKTVLYTRAGQSFSRRVAFDASVAVLPGFAAPAPAFVF